MTPQIFKNLRHPSILRDRSQSRSRIELAHTLYPHEYLKRNPLFTGRESDLKFLDDKLLEDETNPSEPTLLNITGMGGIGKTDLLREFAATRCEHFTAVFWIYAPDFKKSILDITKELGLDPGPSLTSGCIGEYAWGDLVQDWLRKPEWPPRSKQRWLFVLDGVEPKPTIMGYIPDLPECPVVMTTGHMIIGKYDIPDERWLLRGNQLGDQETPLDQKPIDSPPYLMEEGEILNSQIWFYGHRWTILDSTLQPLSKEDAGSYLLSRIGHREGCNDVKVLEKIGERLGGLPIALKQTAHFLLNSGVTWPAQQVLEYLVGNEDKRHTFYSWFPLRHQFEQPHVYSIVDEFSEFSVTKPAFKMLMLMSGLNPDRIPRYLFMNHEGLESKYKDVSSSNRNIEGGQRAMVELLERHYLNNYDSKTREMSMHRGMHDAVRMRMDAKKAVEVFRTLLEMIRRHWALFREFYYSAERLVDELVPHFRHLKGWYEESEKLRGKWPGLDLHMFYWLTLDVSRVLKETGHFAESESTREFAQSLDAHRREPGRVIAPVWK